MVAAAGLEPATSRTQSEVSDDCNARCYGIINREKRERYLSASANFATPPIKEAAGLEPARFYHQFVYIEVTVSCTSVYY